MSLPEQEHMDGLVRKLANLTDAVDAFHAGVERVAVARMDPHEERRAERVEGLEAAYGASLTALGAQLESTRRWLRQELKQLSAADT